MRVQVKKGGTVSLPRQAMTALGVREQDFLECTLTQKGLLFMPLSRTESMAESKKTKVRIECFGKFSIYQNGRYHPTRNKKAEEMLAYLCCNGGRAVKKRMLEEILWAEAERGRARDSLYKVCNFVSRWQESEHVMLPLAVYREEIYLDTESIELDLQEFLRCLESKDAGDWEQAVRFYTAPLLFENSYEWVEDYEAVYDMAYYEALDRLYDYYKKQGNGEKVLYYQRKLKGFR